MTFSILASETLRWTYSSVPPENWIHKKRKKGEKIFQNAHLDFISIFLFRQELSSLLPASYYIILPYIYSVRFGKLKHLPFKNKEIKKQDFLKLPKSNSHCFPFLKAIVLGYTLLVFFFFGG